MGLTKNGNAMSWGGVARQAGLHDPNARLRGLWQQMTNGEKLYLVAAAGLPKSTALNDILKEPHAEAIRAAIRRASRWAELLQENI